jgi:exonuclease III
MAPPHRSTNDSILVMGGSLNTQSIRNKCTAIIDFIIKHELTILAINETWLTGNVTLDNAIMKDSCPPNYQSIHKPRIGKKSGGLAFIFKTSLKTSTLPLTVSVTTFECLPIKVTVASKTIVIINIYRPPSTCLNIFYEELADLFAHFLSIYEEVIFVGDFNVRILTDARIHSDFNNLLA